MCLSLTMEFNNLFYCKDLPITDEETEAKRSVAICPLVIVNGRSASPTQASLKPQTLTQ